MRVHVNLVLDTSAFKKVLSMFQASPEARFKIDNLDELGVLTRFNDMLQNYGCKVENYEVLQSEQ